MEGPRLPVAWRFGRVLEMFFSSLPRGGYQMEVTESSGR